MPNVTDKYGFPYPVKGDAADGPDGFQKLAQKIEDVLFTQFGKVSTADTPEIAFTSIDPLKAALTGTREGAWNVTGAATVGTTLATGQGITAGASITVPDADVIVGKAGAGVQRMFRSFGRWSSVEYEARFALSSGGDAYLQTLKAGTSVAIFYVTDSGQLLHTYGGVTRLIPFATYAGTISVAYTADASKTVSINFPTGRFTTDPIVSATLASSSSFIVGALGSTDKSGADISTRYYTGAAVSLSFVVQVLAVQMTPTAGAGLRSVPTQEDTDEPLVDNIATCHTSGCENEGHQVRRMRPVGADIVCGPCGQPITDVVEV